MLTHVMDQISQSVDLESQDARSPAVFPADVLTYAITVWPTAIEFDVVTRLGRGGACL